MPENIKDVEADSTLMHFVIIALHIVTLPFSGTW